MQKFTGIGVSLPNDVLTLVDECRGSTVSRSEMIRQLVERGISANVDKSQGGTP
jgi:metal-responsive CopG/Arc/MetJ family transcriptional regulator